MYASVQMEPFNIWDTTLQYRDRNCAAVGGRDEFLENNVFINHDGEIEKLRGMNKKELQDAKNIDVDVKRSIAKEWEILDLTINTAKQKKILFKEDKRRYNCEDSTSSQRKEVSAARLRIQKNREKRKHKKEQVAKLDEKMANYKWECGREPWLPNGGKPDSVFDLLVNEERGVVKGVCYWERRPETQREWKARVEAEKKEVEELKASIQKERQRIWRESYRRACIAEQRDCHMDDIPPISIWKGDG